MNPKVLIENAPTDEIREELIAWQEEQEENEEPGWGLMGWED